MRAESTWNSGTGYVSWSIMALKSWPEYSEPILRWLSIFVQVENVLVIASGNPVGNALVSTTIPSWSDGESLTAVAAPRKKAPLWLRISLPDKSWFTFHPRP